MGQLRRKAVRDPERRRNCCAVSAPWEGFLRHHILIRDTKRRIGAIWPTVKVLDGPLQVLLNQAARSLVAGMFPDVVGVAHTELERLKQVNTPLTTPNSTHIDGTCPHESLMARALFQLTNPRVICTVTRQMDPLNQTRSSQ